MYLRAYKLVQGPSLVSNRGKISTQAVMNPKLFPQAVLMAGNFRVGLEVEKRL